VEGFSPDLDSPDLEGFSPDLDSSDLDFSPDVELSDDLDFSPDWDFSDGAFSDDDPLEPADSPELELLLRESVT